MTYRVPDTVAYAFGSELDPADQRVFMVTLPDGHPVVLTGSAAIIWSAAASGVVDVVATVAGDFELEPAAIHADVEAFLVDAVTRGLLIVEEPDV